MPAHAPNVPPSNIFATPAPSVAPVISPVAIPGLTPRQNAPSRSSSAARSSLPPIFTDRRTPAPPSTLAAKRLSHGLSPTPFQTHSRTVGWDRAAQEVLETPIEEEDHRLDVDMGGDGYVDNVYTSGSTSLQAPTTDDEPPPSTPNGEDMELDMNVLKERSASVSVVPVQGPVHVPASVANVSLSLQLLRQLTVHSTDCYSARSIVSCQSLSSELLFEY